MLCPYCADSHHANTCPKKTTSTSNCTACARRMKATDPKLDLPLLFSTTPVLLRNSPLDPTCPAKIALAVEKAKQAADLRNEQRGERPAKNPATETSVPGTSATGSANPLAPFVVTEQATSADAQENIAMELAQ